MARSFEGLSLSVAMHFLSGPACCVIRRSCFHPQKRESRCERICRESVRAEREPKRDPNGASAARGNGLLLLILVHPGVGAGDSGAAENSVLSLRVIREHLLAIFRVGISPTCGRSAKGWC